MSNIDKLLYIDGLGEITQNLNIGGNINLTETLFTKKIGIGTSNIASSDVFHITGTTTLNGALKNSLGRDIMVYDTSENRLYIGNDGGDNIQMFHPFLVLPKIENPTKDNYYNIVPNGITADIEIHLPLLTGNDEFVFKDATQTLTNKTLTSPTITGTGTIAGTFTGGLTGDVTGNADTATKIASITNDNIVQLTNTQTLTNKTLTSPTITNPIITGTVNVDVIQDNIFLNYPNELIDPDDPDYYYYPRAYVYNNSGTIISTSAISSESHYAQDTHNNNKRWTAINHKFIANNVSYNKGRLYDSYGWYDSSVGNNANNGNYWKYWEWIVLDTNHTPITRDIYGIVISGSGTTYQGRYYVTRVMIEYSTDGVNYVSLGNYDTNITNSSESNNDVKIISVLFTASHVRIYPLATNTNNGTGPLYMSTALKIKYNGGITIGNLRLTSTHISSSESLDIYCRNITCNEVTESSDKRIKTNIIDADLNECIDVLKSIKLKKYKYTNAYQETYNTTTDKIYGFLADDILENQYLSYCGKISKVPTNLKDGTLLNDFKIIEKNKILSVLWGVCNFQQNKIETLESKISILENEIAKIKSAIF